MLDTKMDVYNVHSPGEHEIDAKEDMQTLKGQN